MNRESISKSYRSLLSGIRPRQCFLYRKCPRRPLRPARPLDPMDRVCLFCRLGALRARRPQSAASAAASGRRHVQTRRSDEEGGTSDNGLEGVLTDYGAWAPAAKDPRSDARRPVTDPVLPAAAQQDGDRRFGSLGGRSLVRRVSIQDAVEVESFRVWKIMVPDGDPPEREALRIRPRQTPIEDDPQWVRPLVRTKTFFAGPRLIRERSQVDNANQERPSEFRSLDRRREGRRAHKWEQIRRRNQSFPAPSPYNPSPSREAGQPQSSPLIQNQSTPPPMLQDDRSVPRSGRLIRYHSLEERQPLPFLDRHRAFRLAKYLQSKRFDVPASDVKKRVFRKRAVEKPKWVIRSPHFIVRRYLSPRGLTIKRIPVSRTLIRSYRYMRARRQFNTKWHLNSIQESKLRINELVRLLIRSAPTSTQPSHAGTNGERLSSTASPTTEASDSVPGETNLVIDSLMAAMLAPGGMRGSSRASPSSRGRKSLNVLPSYAEPKSSTPPPTAPTPNSVPGRTTLPSPIDRLTAMIAPSAEPKSSMPPPTALTSDSVPGQTNLPSSIDRLKAMIAPSARWRSVKRNPGVREFTTMARKTNSQRAAQDAGLGGNAAELELQRVAAINPGFRLRHISRETPKEISSLFQRESPAPSTHSGLNVRSLYGKARSTMSSDDWTPAAQGRRETPLSDQPTQFRSLFSGQDSTSSNERWTPTRPSQQRFAASFGGKETSLNPWRSTYNPSTENWRADSRPRGVETGFNYNHGERDTLRPRRPGPSPTPNFRRDDDQEHMKFPRTRGKAATQAKAHNPRLRVDKLLQDMQDMRSDARHNSRKNANRGRRRDDDEDEDERYRQNHKHSRSKKAQARKAHRKQEEAKPQNQLKLPAHISVANLANVFGVRYEAFAQTMKKLGFEDIRHDFVLSSEDAGLIAMEFGYQPVFDKSAVELVASPWPEDEASLPARPPVVTIMGHVDHGKTTILDYLRKSSVAANEHGGITQHIGAFSVSLASGKKITFLDTPGHAAFLSMRQRGANVTDIVILVVAADDGIMPQTIEAIKHAQAAQVPIIVAINKVDKPEKNITRIMQGLARHNVEPEEFGGDTQVVQVSGKTGQGMPDLEEAILTLSEILDHRAPPDGAVEGWVLESSVKSSHGKVATVLVRRGTLRPGDVVVAGAAWARARTLRDAAGRAVAEAGPGTPVELDGWRQRPAPGDEVLQAPGGERAAAAVAAARAARAGMARLARDVAAVNAARRRGGAEDADGAAAAAASKEERHRDRAIDGVFVEKSPSAGGALDVHFVVKADVVGSAEAATNLIAGLGDGGRTVRASVVRARAGPVCESDVELASCAGGGTGVVLAFNTGVEPGARELAARRGVRVLEHSVIYRIAEDVVRLMESRLPDVVSWRVLGDGLVFATDRYTVKGRRTKRIAGVKVKSGTLVTGGAVRVTRKSEQIYDGEIYVL